MNTFFVPGPTQIAPEILEELCRPMIGHRSGEYAKLHAGVIEKLKKLFHWENFHIFLMTSSATGTMEGTIRNCVGKNVLHTVCGAFSEKWEEISRMNGKKTYQIKVPWGQSIDPEAVAKKLTKINPEAVTITYCETSTGVLNPLEKICKKIREQRPESLILVDAVSAFGGAPLEMEKWGIDVMFFGVQKTFALPPGLAIAVVSKRAFEKSLMVKNRGYYFNFEIFEKYNQKNNTPATPAVSLIFALNKQLDRIKLEGLNARYQRHQKMQHLIEIWQKQRNLEFFSQKNFRSPTVSTLKVPAGMDILAVVQRLKERGITMPAGYGPIKTTTFRIGHMGEHNEQTVSFLLEELDKLLT